MLDCQVPSFLSVIASHSTGFVANPKPKFIGPKELDALRGKREREREIEIEIEYQNQSKS